MTVTKAITSFIMQLMFGTENYEVFRNDTNFKQDFQLSCIINAHKNIHIYIHKYKVQETVSIMV